MCNVDNISETDCKQRMYPAMTILNISLQMCVCMYTRIRTHTVVDRAVDITYHIGDQPGPQAQCASLNRQLLHTTPHPLPMPLFPLTPSTHIELQFANWGSVLKPNGITADTSPHLDLQYNIPAFPKRWVTTRYRATKANWWVTKIFLFNIKFHNN